MPVPVATGPTDADLAVRPPDDHLRRGPIDGVVCVSPSPGRSAAHVLALSVVDRFR